MSWFVFNLNQIEGKPLYADGVGHLPHQAMKRSADATRPCCATGWCLTDRCRR